MPHIPEVFGLFVKGLRAIFKRYRVHICQQQLLIHDLLRVANESVVCCLVSRFRLVQDVHILILLILIIIVIAAIFLLQIQLLLLPVPDDAITIDRAD